MPLLACRGRPQPRHPSSSTGGIPIRQRRGLRAPSSPCRGHPQPRHPPHRQAASSSARGTASLGVLGSTPRRSRHCHPLALLRVSQTSAAPQHQRTVICLSGAGVRTQGVHPYRPGVSACHFSDTPFCRSRTLLCGLACARVTPGACRPGLPPVPPTVCVLPGPTNPRRLSFSPQYGNDLDLPLRRQRLRVPPFGKRGEARRKVSRASYR